jgi:hypothetical protein
MPELKIVYNLKMDGIGRKYRVQFFCYDLLPNIAGLNKFGNSILRILELPEQSDLWQQASVKHCRRRSGREWSTSHPSIPDWSPLHFPPVTPSACKTRPVGYSSFVKGNQLLLLRKAGYG